MTEEADSSAADPTDDDILVEAERVAMRLLAPRDHASGELRRKLASRDFDDTTIETIIERFREQGYLDDQAFAIRQAELLADKSWGPRRIRQKLYKRDLDDHHIDLAIEEAGTSLSWAAQCRDRLESRFAPPDRLTRSEKQKAFRHLRHRGYRASTIRTVLFDGAGA